ncbi:unnamed protein product [Symbiodinium sp. CCMP2456]|nr:unnamed protein product [Symbiodinium sp. CCMP2456]
MGRRSKLRFDPCAAMTGKGDLHLIQKAALALAQEMKAFASERSELADWTHEYLQRSPSMPLQADALGNGFCCLDRELQCPKQPCGSKVRWRLLLMKGKGRGKPAGNKGGLDVVPGGDRDQ